MRTYWKNLSLLTCLFAFTCLEAKVLHKTKVNKPVANSQKVSDFTHLTPEMCEALGPYLIHGNHPLKNSLDQIFSKVRVTRNKTSFANAGFKILDQRPRSYVVVARHPKLSGHLVKCYLDLEKREKWDRPSWYWLAKRCEGARKIKVIIQKYKIKHFSVPDKYIYILPILEKTGGTRLCYLRHPALLLVTDMNLVSEKENLYAWSHRITKEMLRELYLIITLAKGSSYRAENIAYSHSGKFCFIDCEYPSRGPDYDRIEQYLSPSMREYWNQLVQQGKLNL